MWQVGGGGSFFQRGGSWVTLGLLGPFVIPQPLLRCLCWRRMCRNVVSHGAVLQFPLQRRETGRAHCLPVAALATAWQDFVMGDHCSERCPSPPISPACAPPACPLSLLKRGGFIAPGGAFNHFPVSCKAGALQIAWLPLRLWVQHPHSPSHGRLREVAANAGQSRWRQSKRRYSVCSRC